MGLPFSQVPTWDDRTPIYVISVAAQLAGMHPQTLRQYDRLGLVTPSRASGRGRRYSAYDVAKLRYVQHLSQEEGVNLAGIRHILALQSEVEDLRKRVNQLLAEVQRGVGVSRQSSSSRVFSAGPAGDVIAMGRQQTTTRWIRTQPLELGPR
ncbi:MerR family transcriptional regulator [Kribbella pittospori]|jgi:MerR family transcriptional regulator, heat shock protein HspR|uniref:MerR family transcriptional regulator n=2 Tax=Kribbella TaxID=182639 RepID=A0A4R0K5R3_9ACTN|nr:MULTISPECIES: helix-turn-helix transcriptional regulator [Kribbella]TCC53286.1 MerR family transcriptional regulator [Kribbella capetownensis]TCC55917.1 MerR family transcriptional regulator [Kribbella pittospori]WSY22809.1 helix-turn-helix transcriptional regulator [Kribbella sp. NBC_00889]